MTRVLGSGLGVVALAVFAAACSGDSAPGGGACRSNRDCGTGEQCVSGMCIEASAKGCTNDDGCPLGKFCDIATHACVDENPNPLPPPPPPTPECTEDLACPAHQRCDLSTMTCVNGRRHCADEAQCSAIGQHCDTGKGECVDCFMETDCVAPMKCTAGECVDPSLSTACNGDVECSPPSTICIGAMCVRGCSSAGAADCATGEMCNATTGRCEATNPNPNPNACTGDAMCGAPSAVCEMSMCIPGCAQLGGLTCAGGNVCDTNTGRCVAVSGPCMNDVQCNAPTSVCESGQCIPGCGRAGGVQCVGATTCNPMSGRCEAGGNFCSNDLECNSPAEVCNLNTGACDPGCGTAACPMGSTCNAMTGHCAGTQMCGTDGYEPNDARTSPSAIAPGTVNPLFACPGNEDFYSLNLGIGDQLTINATFGVGEGNIDLEMFDPAGNVVASGRTTGSNETIMFTAATAGAHVLHAFLAQDLGPNPGNSYSLQVTLVGAPCGTDSFEENDAETAAASISPGPHPGLNVCTGDDDFYAIPVNSGDQITATVTFDNNEGDIDLRLINVLGFNVSTSAGTGNTETINFTANLSATYYLRVYLFTDRGTVQGNPYSLDLTWGPTAPPPPPPTCTADGLEDNDALASPRSVSPGNHPDLTLCTGDDDYYSVAMANGDRVTVNLAFTNTEGDIDLQFLDSAGTVLQSSGSTTNAESITHTAGAAGTYYIRSYLYGDAGSTPGNSYSMDVQLTPVAGGCASDGYEPNNTRATAVAMPGSSYPSLNVCTADDDYYNVTLTAGEVLTVGCSFMNAQGDIDVSLLDSAGTVLLASQTTTDLESISFTVTTSGTYTVRVYLYADYGTTTGNTYNLTLTH